MKEQSVEKKALIWEILKSRKLECSYNNKDMAKEMTTFRKYIDSRQQQGDFNMVKGSNVRHCY